MTKVLRMAKKRARATRPYDHSMDDQSTSGLLPLIYVADLCS